MRHCSGYALIGMVLASLTMSAWADRDRNTDVRFASREHRAHSAHQHYRDPHWRDPRAYRGGHRYHYDHPGRAYSWHDRHHHHGRSRYEVRSDRHHYHHHYYPQRVIVYREYSDRFYPWAGGAFLAGEIIHHLDD